MMFVTSTRMQTRNGTIRLIEVEQNYWHLEFEEMNGDLWVLCEIQNADIKEAKMQASEKLVMFRDAITEAICKH